jgi:hypothetical protein
MLKIRRSRRDSRKVAKLARALASLDQHAAVVRSSERRNSRVFLGA